MAPINRGFARMITLTAAALTLAATVSARAETTRVDLGWDNGDVHLEGTLFLPEGPGPHPVATFFHGSKAATRSDLLYRLYAARMAKRGLAMLIYDKRGCGDSTGDWREAVYEDYARDGLAGLERVAARSDIDGNRIGVFGQSEGGWVGPLAATLSPRVKFVVMLSGPPMSPAEHGRYEVETALRAEGIGEAEIEEALALWELKQDVIRGKGVRVEFAEAIERVADEPWGEIEGIATMPNLDNPVSKWYQRIMDYDALSVLEGLNAPVFAAYGGADILVPGPRSAEIMLEIARTHGKDFRVMLIDGARHNLTVERKGWTPEYWSALDSWIDEKVLLKN